ncbi:MAG: TerD family protein [Synergistaceae bacterium]|jgi:tellurite resistance protein TerA|nr:TerD family protein [Synergistaceae bacterium]
MELIRGQKLKFADVAASGVFEVLIDIQSNLVVDTSCFGLDEARKLSDDRYFIFYNQKASPCSSIVLQKSPLFAGKEVFKLNLSTLPSSIKNIVFAATIDQEGAMSAIGPSALRLAEKGEERLIFPFSGRDFSSEKAVMVAELYFKDQWRFSAVGQGFNGGLSALLKHFGGEEITPPPASKVNLGKVTLEKRGAAQKVDLAKHATPVHINLQWNAPQQGKGFFQKKSSDVDLDLGCMYRLKNGNMGVIQPLGGNFGSRNGSPYIYLDKDDRSGAAADGENMYVFHPEEIELMVIFAMIYEGTAEFTAVSGRVTIEREGNFEIAVPLNNPEGGKRFCAVARIEPDGDSIRVTKDELYFPGHRECDTHYGFGFQWKPGRK